MKKIWAQLPASLRKFLSVLIKALLTGGAFYLLLTHPIDSGDGTKTRIVTAITEHVGELELSRFLPLLLVATSIKVVGIAASMLRWHVLLIGQGIRFNFGHIVGSFLIGRFLGTFLPSTVGLDGYKLYDAARFSDRVVEPAAATAVEKVMGLAGVFLCFLVTLPFGYAIFGERASLVILATVPIAGAAVLGLFLALFSPGLLQALLRLVPAFGRRRIAGFIERVGNAASAYKGQGALLAAVMGLSFIVHFTTAAMYFFTALAVGAAGASFGEVTLASSIQIFATVMSPFTLAGEGVREIVQALLLAKRIGASASVLSAALGFWAAEALTLVGAFFWWARKDGYTPKRVTVPDRPRQAA